MSVCSKYFGCRNGDPEWKAVLKALTLMDSDGNKFINICYTDRAACTDGRGNAVYESAFECLQDASFSDVLELIVGVDECGNPNINVLANVCEECAEDEQGGIPGPL
jgi:hypothetical protein